MSIAPEPSATRGEITLQPSYFTSSLYVNPLREDISTLISSFSDQYNPSVRPFELFKKLWTDQGWQWLHLRVHDGRSRQSFLKITARLFVEQLGKQEDPLTRVAALFALYTFHETQPSTSAPHIFSVPHTAIPLDLYKDMLETPSALGGPDLCPLKPYVAYVLSTMLDAQAFQIMPRSSLNAQNPSSLPREIFIPDGQEASAVMQATLIGAPSQEAGASSAPKKKGRPSKRDKIRKAKEALHSLDRYVDRTYLALHQDPYQLRMTVGPPAAGAGPVQAGHALFAQAPAGSLHQYSVRKNDLLAALHAGSPDGPERAALRRINESVLARLKQIDEMAAEKGLEVGGEGGEKTGLARVEKAVEELRQTIGVGASGGILRLLEGAGMDV